MRAHADLATERFDVVVVGAGASGAVLASCLSEDANRRVLLLEAGCDTLADPAMQQAVRDARQPAVLPGLNWKIRTRIKGDASLRNGGSFFDYEAGKLVGGSSAINAVQALRGHPPDYDEWAALVGPEWSWASVLPYFRKLEDDPIGNAELHGIGGPMPVRRERQSELRPLQAALMEACIAQGFPETDDHNDPATTGVGIIPKNVVGGVRISTAIAYLAGARGRPNLRIVAEAHVHRLLWRSDNICAGVEIMFNGRQLRCFSDLVVLCAGALNTPAILMRSGIGDPFWLEPLDIEVKQPLTGVGRNLMDHPVVGIWGLPNPEACAVGEPLRQTLLRYTSGLSGHDNDMHICMMAGWNAGDMFPQRASSAMAGLTACFNKSTSRGSVRIVSANPQLPPEVSINCLGDPADIAPLKEAVRLAWRLLRQPGLRENFSQALAWTDSMVQSDRALERAVATFVRPSAHLCGSARMGRPNDSGAVVDAQGRVHGVAGLRVADASIMPRIPSAPTHLTSLMIAEKIAADIRAGS